MEDKKPPRAPQAGEKYIVRFPEGMRERIAEAAKESGRSMNAEIVQRVERSFEPVADVGMASVVVRLNTELADVEQQLAEAKLHLAELALTLRLAVYSIPGSARAADPQLDADIKQWLDESAELLEKPDELLREVEEKTQKFLEVTKRLGEFAAELKDLNDAKERRLLGEANPPPSSNLQLSLGKPRRKLDTD